MHKRKRVVPLSKHLKAKDDVSTQITPPPLTDEQADHVKKLLSPIFIPSQTSVREEDRESGASKSNTPSPRQSVCELTPTRKHNEEITLKILVIGDSTVGKTSYVQRYVQQKFIRNYTNTVGVDFSTKLLCEKKYGPAPIKLQIWDIAGQDRYICMTRVYYKNADGCIIMFDLTNRKSFESVVQWKHDLDSKCFLDNDQMLPCLLLASKCDLPGRQVEINEIENVCSQYNFISWIEISSKEHMMIEDSMNFLVDRIVCSKRMSCLPPSKTSTLVLEKEKAMRRKEEKVAVSSYCWC